MAGDQDTTSARLLSRRQAITVGGAGAFALVLAACSSSTGTATSGTTAGTKPGTGVGTVPAARGTGTTPGAVPTVVLDPVTTAHLDELLAQGMAATGVPGVSAGVWIGDQTWRRTIGVADLQTKTPYRADDQARIASITKTFTGTAVLQLVDAKKVSLDDVLEQFVPGLPNGTRITVRQLLDMSSGLFDFTADAAFVAQFDADPTMPWTLEQTLAIIEANPPDFEPGTAVAYCDSNYVLLGAIVEKVTGRSLGEVVTTEIIGKLGLTGTSYPTMAAVPSPHPTAYLPDISGAANLKKPYPFDNAAKPPKVVNEVNPAVSAGAGAMISTVDDLRRWAEELATGTLLAPPTQAARLVSKPFTGQTVAGYGLGLLTIGSLVGHNGAIIGYNAFAMHHPASGATFVAVSNEANNFTSATTEIMLPIVKALYPQALG